MYFRPLLMFSRNNMKADLMDGAPPRSTATWHKAGRIQIESFRQWFKYFVRFAKPYIEDHVILTLVVHYPHWRNIEAIDCSRENGVHIVCFLRIAPLNCNFWALPSCCLWRHTTQSREKFGWKFTQTELLRTIKLLYSLGKLTWNRLQQPLLQTGSGKQACFLGTVTLIDGHDFLEVSQRNITSCMLESPVICTSNSKQPSTTSGTSPETLASTVTQPASQNSSAVVLPSDIGPVPDISGRKQEQLTKHAAFPQRTAAILKSSP
jgi:hypothetical protein